jgi:hypothetical protein
VSVRSTDPRTEAKVNFILGKVIQIIPITINPETPKPHIALAIIKRFQEETCATPISYSM